MAPSEGTPFRVECSAAVAASIRRLYRQAAGLGFDDDFVAALARIQQQLQADPTGFGEALYTLKHLDITVYVAAAPPLAVSYGVNVVTRVVYLRELRLMEQ